MIKYLSSVLSEKKTYDIQNAGFVFVFDEESQQREGLTGL